MAFQKCFATKPASTESTGIPVVVEDCDVLSQRSFGRERNATAFESLVAGLMHGCNVAFEVITTIGNVTTVLAREQLPPECVANEHGQVKILAIRVIRRRQVSFERSWCGRQISFKCRRWGRKTAGSETDAGRNYWWLISSEWCWARLPGFENNWRRRQ